VNKKSTIAWILASMMLLASCGKTEIGDEIPVGETGKENGGETAADTSPSSDASSDDTTDDASGSAFDYSTADLSAYIKLGQYEGLSVTMASAVLTDEEFENEVQFMLENYSEYEQITDRDVVEGDVVIADYSGYRDGVQFAGGTAAGQSITAAPNTGYIEGFAEAFIGQTPGKEFSFDVTFPEDYGNTDLAGVEVTFVCTVHSIQGTEMIVPELNDAFVQKTFGYNNVEEFNILYRESVEKQKAYMVESEMYADLWTQIVGNTEVIRLPEEEVQRVYQEKRSLYETYAGYFGTTYEQFISDYYGMTDEDLMEESRNYVKEDLVMYHLMDKLGIVITDEIYNERLNFFADYYGATVEELMDYYGEETMTTTIIWQEVMETIAEKTNITRE